MGSTHIFSNWGTSRIIRHPAIFHISVQPESRVPSSQLLGCCCTALCLAQGAAQGQYKSRFLLLRSYQLRLKATCDYRSVRFIGCRCSEVNEGTDHSKPKELGKTACRATERTGFGGWEDLDR